MNWKKGIAVLSVLIMLGPSLLGVQEISAAENDLDFEQEIETDIQNLNNIFLDIHEDSKELVIEKLQTDEEVYAFLLQNIENVSIDDNGLLVVNYDDIFLIENTTKEEKTTVKNFVNSINSLVNNQAISINQDLLFTFVKAPDIDLEPRMFRAQPIMSLMYLSRTNKNTLKSVFDNAPFSTKHIVAGLYFAERVKTNGQWDLKVQLGVNTTYYIDDLGYSMTGEAIGNFHYGYVGRAVFSGVILKSAAGMYQIISSTSSLKYYDSYFDDPRDTAQIQRGIDRYNAEH